MLPHMTGFPSSFLFEINFVLDFKTMYENEMLFLIRIVFHVNKFSIKKCFVLIGGKGESSSMNPTCI